VESIETQQKEVCLKYGSAFIEAEQNTKVGIALDTVGSLPLNALRHPPEGDTCGWYIWGGEELPQDPDFFQPLHVSHLKDMCPEIVKYLGLAPGWRVLVSSEYEDVWYDEKLLDVEV
jgi:hypothetical protein